MGRQQPTKSLLSSCVFSSSSPPCSSLSPHLPSSSSCSSRSIIISYRRKRIRSIHLNQSSFSSSSFRRSFAFLSPALSLPHRLYSPRYFSPSPSILPLASSSSRSTKHARLPLLSQGLCPPPTSPTYLSSSSFHSPFSSSSHLSSSFSSFQDLLSCSLSDLSFPHPPPPSPHLLSFTREALPSGQFLLQSRFHIVQRHLSSARSLLRRESRNAEEKERKGSPLLQKENERRPRRKEEKDEEQEEESQESSLGTALREAQCRGVWTHVDRPETFNALDRLLTDSRHTQHRTGVVWLVGPVGSGKTYGAQYAVQRVKRTVKKEKEREEEKRQREEEEDTNETCDRRGVSCCVLAFGMKAVNHLKFSLLLGAFERSLRKQLLDQHEALLLHHKKQPKSSSSCSSPGICPPTPDILTGPWICSSVERKCPSFRSAVSSLLMQAAGGRSERRRYEGRRSVGNERRQKTSSSVSPLSPSLDGDNSSSTMPKKKGKEESITTHDHDGPLEGSSSSSPSFPFIFGGRTPQEKKERQAQALKFADILSQSSQERQPFPAWKGLLEFLSSHVSPFHLSWRESKPPSQKSSSSFSSDQLANTAFDLLQLASEYEESKIAASESHGAIAHYRTGQLWLEFFFRGVVSEYKNATGVGMSVWIDDVEVLCLSRYLDQRGSAFLSSLHKLFLDPSMNFPVVFITADALTSIQGICLPSSSSRLASSSSLTSPSSSSLLSPVDPLVEKEDRTSDECLVAYDKSQDHEDMGNGDKDVCRARKEKVTNQEGERSSRLDADGLSKSERRRGRATEVIEVGDLTRQTVTDLLVPGVTCVEEIPRALYIAVGGNIALIERFTKGLIKLNGDMWLAENRPKPPGYVQEKMDRDESTLPADASPEEECTWRWNEQQKEYTRNIMQNLLVEDVRVFEWRMNRFLSLPLIDSLREKQSNRIHFLVTVYETIRYFTSKPYLLCTDLLKIDNVVILGLVDAGILISRFNPSRLEVANELYRHLLSDFINVRYSALSLEEKATYNMNMLINQTAIRYHVDRLSDMQESPSTPPPQDQLRHCSRSPSEIP